MLNHFSTLLLNLNSQTVDILPEDYLLGSELDEFLIAEDGAFIKLSDIYQNFIPARKASKYICPGYIETKLPAALQNFYSLIFPSEASEYYKEFLLFNYLNIMDSAGMNKHLTDYDARITYNLFEEKDFFTLSRTSNSAANNTDYTLSVTGKLGPAVDWNSSTIVFVLRQLANTENCVLFSPTQKKFYKAGKPASKTEKDMSVMLELDPIDLKTTKPIKIGSTGLITRIHGPFNDIVKGFTTSANKIWSFSAEAKLEFEFLHILEAVKNYPRITEEMFAFSRDVCNISYENLWTSHYNSVYSFAGLLLAYVQRVNLVWARKAT